MAFSRARMLSLADSKAEKPERLASSAASSALKLFRTYLSSERPLSQHFSDWFEKAHRQVKTVDRNPAPPCSGWAGQPLVHAPLQVNMQASKCKHLILDHYLRCLKQAHAHNQPKTSWHSPLTLFLAWYIQLPKFCQLQKLCYQSTSCRSSTPKSQSRRAGNSAAQSAAFTTETLQSTVLWAGLKVK